MLEQLDSAHATGKPIFAHMAFYAVHGPFEADPQFLANYPGDQAGKTFAAMIEGMDHAVGRILSHLEMLGIAEDTLVFFLGDNGSVHSSEPLRGKKAERFEGGTRVPFIVSWAKPSDREIQSRWPIPAGTHHTESFGTILDLMPTTLNLTDTQAPEGYILDGYDLRAVHAGETKQTFLMHFPHKHRSSYFTTWHNRDWKLIYQYHGEPRLQLFNLEKDPNERNDLAVQNPELLQGMLSEMKHALKESGALFPTSQKLGESTHPHLN
jgi:arylsulfatase A-like enzyme